MHFLLLVFTLVLVNVDAQWTYKCGSEEVDWQIITYQAAMQKTFPNLVFDCNITLLALNEVKNEVQKEFTPKPSDRSVVAEGEKVVTLNGRKYSSFVAKERGIDLDSESRRELLGHMFDSRKAELAKRYKDRRPSYGCAAKTMMVKGWEWRVAVCLITY